MEVPYQNINLLLLEQTKLLSSVYGFVFEPETCKAEQEVKDTQEEDKDIKIHPWQLDLIN